MIQELGTNDAAMEQRLGLSLVDNAHGHNKYIPCWH